MASLNYEIFDVGNSTFNPPYEYCDENYPWQNYQNIPESELCAPTQSYVWNVCDMCGGQDGHFHGCAYISYLPPTPYYDDSTFSCEDNRNKEPREADLKKIEDMLKCIIEQQSKIQLQVERQDETVRNLEAQVSQLVEAFNAQYVNIMDSSREQFALETEIEVPMEGSKVELQHSNHIDFEDADVVEEILESTKDIEDTYLVDSIVISVENVDCPNVHVVERIGPHSKHFSTLCLDDDMKIESSEPLEESRNEEQSAYILEFFFPKSRDYTPHIKAKKCRILHYFIGPVRFVPPPHDRNHKFESKLGVQFINSRWRQKVIRIVSRR
ncbi:uncharacterized protein LOC107829108 [Nicotiana tabacum]|uniref:Uncharacterized protein LOC107829108 n=14 Tax=Nicotiana tabacum TaxID=4097 RepID=A0AC58U946_TOBAC